MPISGADLLKAYGAQPPVVQAAPPKPGGDTGLSFVLPLVGLIQPTFDRPDTPEQAGSQAAKGVLFARREFCTFWVYIPGNLIDQVELLGKESCEGSIYDYVRLTLKNPTTPEGTLYADLMQQEQLTSTKSVVAAYPSVECRLCKEVPGYGDLKNGLEKLRDKGVITDEDSCKALVSDVSRVIQLLTPYLGPVALGLGEVIRRCGKCACKDIF